MLLELVRLLKAAQRLQSSGEGATSLGAPTNTSVSAGDGRLTLNFTANPIVGANVSSSVLFNTMNETCNREDYWIVRSNVLTAHQFTAGSSATITKFEIRMGAGLQQYPSQIRIAFYQNGAGDTIGTRLSGTLTLLHLHQTLRYTPVQSQYLRQEPIGCN